MKTYTLTLSRNFPATHPRKGEETGFIDNILAFKKIHTIRSNYEFWRKRFDEIEKGNAYLSLRYWEGKPYRSNQVEFKRLIKEDGIGLQCIDLSIFSDLGLCFLNTKNSAKRISPICIAKNDGLSSNDFRKWFKNYSLNEPMAIIHFTNTRRLCCFYRFTMKKKSYLTVTDQFCGAGGSSQGVRRLAQNMGGGLEVKLAMNHWDLAIKTHNTNFPDTDHDCADVSATDPRRYQSTDILITSPECTNHTIAKGVSRKYQLTKNLFGDLTIDPGAIRSRATMWDDPRFAEIHNYNLKQESGLCGMPGCMQCTILDTRTNAYILIQCMLFQHRRAGIECMLCSGKKGTLSPIWIFVQNHFVQIAGRKWNLYKAGGTLERNSENTSSNTIIGVPIVAAS